MKTLLISTRRPITEITPQVPRQSTPRIDLHVTFVSGNFFFTGFNGTLEDARRYYRPGKRWNVGSGEEDFYDTIQTVDLVEYA